MIVEKTVLVFDICSSTSMMEDVQMNSSLDSYAEMIENIRLFLAKTKKKQYEIYKFLGDGFILLFNKEVSAESIYRFSEELVDISNNIIKAFILEKMQVSVLPRVGITIGVDSGTLLKANGEYVGRAINIACRLQGKLDLTESVNRIIISKKVYGTIKDALVRRQFEHKPKKLKNVSGGSEFSCYESSPLVSTHAKMTEKATAAETTDAYVATGQSVIETFKNANGKFQFRIVRNNGELVYTSGEFDSLEDLNRKNDYGGILPI